MSDPLKYWRSKNGKLKIHCPVGRTTRWLHYPVATKDVADKIRNFCACCDVQLCPFDRSKPLVHIKNTEGQQP